jgi:hypothetical protein
MTDAHDTTTSRTDTDRPSPEASPSAGWRETAASMHVPAGLEECDVPECDRDGEPVRVVDGSTDDVRREAIRCSEHTKEFLEVSS